MNERRGKHERRGREREAHSDVLGRLDDSRLALAAEVRVLLEAVLHHRVLRRAHGLRFIVDGRPFR